jgi:hypothetical protein
VLRDTSLALPLHLRAGKPVPINEKMLIRRIDQARKHMNPRHCSFAATSMTRLLG